MEPVNECSAAEVGPTRSSRLSSWYYYEQYKSVYDDYTQFTDLSRDAEIATLQNKIDRAVRAHWAKQNLTYYGNARTSSGDDSGFKKTKTSAQNSNKSSPSISVRTVIKKSDFDLRLQHEIGVHPIPNPPDTGNADECEDNGLVFKSAHDIPLGETDAETNSKPLTFYSRDIDEYGNPDSPGERDVSLNAKEFASEMSISGRREDIEISSYPFWSTFMSLIYSTMELNRLGGTRDSSFQLTLGILLCNVVFKKVMRGATKLCDSLQPFVSPVKLSASSKSMLKRSCFTLTERWVESKSDKDLQCTASIMSQRMSETQRSVNANVNQWIHTNYNPNILKVIQDNLQYPYSREGLRLYYQHYFRNLDEICKKNSKKPAPEVHTNDYGYINKNLAAVQHSLEPLIDSKDVSARRDRYKRTRMARQA